MRIKYTAVHQMTKATQKFQIGQKVNAIAFIDCFGKQHPLREGLTVVHVNHVAESSIPAYCRYTASKEHVTIEGAEHFFEASDAPLD